jgi:hypothetical protein
MESSIVVGTLCPFFPFPLLDPEESLKGLEYPLLFCFVFTFSFFVFFMLRIVSIMCNKCMHFGFFYYTHLDEFVLLLNHDLNEGLQRGHSPQCSSNQPLSMESIKNPK